MRPIPKLLSKTKIMRGYRCHKCIYLTIHHPELEPPITPAKQALFDQGNTVGQKAREYFPGGTLIDNVPWDFSGALAKTRACLAAGAELIYEAAFEYMGCYARADILKYSAETGRYSIYEVKSSTKVKEEHLHDVGLQTWIMAKSGLLIDKVHIVHLNTACRYPDLSNLFTIQDVTEEMRTEYTLVKSKVREIFEVLRDPSIPTIDIGPYCDEPNECEFKSECWQHIPSPSIFNLPGMRDRKWQLYQDGIIHLDDPRLTDLTDLQQRIIHCHQDGERYVDTEAVSSAIANWQYPYIFLDFETINPAIPRYDGCAPYSHIPFQFSAHRIQQPNMPPSHTGYLHENASDPRPALIEALLEACGTEGTIIAYYGKFEADRIAELAQYSAKHRDALLALIERIADPLPILREFVYDNAFGGSFSLKKVAPALLGSDQSYEGMEVADGGAAQRAFETLISPSISAEKKISLRDAMVAYCTKDTQVMVDLTLWMQSLKKT